MRGSGLSMRRKPTIPEISGGIFLRCAWTYLGCVVYTCVLESIHDQLGQTLERQKGEFDILNVLPRRESLCPQLVDCCSKDLLVQLSQCREENRA
jgi:hypothetical protein